MLAEGRPIRQPVEMTLDRRRLCTESADRATTTTSARISVQALRHGEGARELP
jgi:hypothetical protein